MPSYGPRFVSPERPFPFPSQSSDGRRLHCSSYNACLDEAVAKLWPSFTCERCPLRAREELELTPSERLHDMHALCALAVHAGLDEPPANDNQ